MATATHSQLLASVSLRLPIVQPRQSIIDIQQGLLQDCKVFVTDFQIKLDQTRLRVHIVGPGDAYFMFGWVNLTTLELELGSAVGASTG